MAIAFGLRRNRLLAPRRRSAPTRGLFVLFAGLIFFTWGEIFSLFPSTCTDTFGPKFATVNTSLLYTAKGTSALLVPLANVSEGCTGGLAGRLHGHGDRQLCRGRDLRCSCCVRCVRGSRLRQCLGRAARSAVDATVLEEPQAPSGRLKARRSGLRESGLAATGTAS